MQREGSLNLVQEIGIIDMTFHVPTTRRQEQSGCICARLFVCLFVCLLVSGKVRVSRQTEKLRPTHFPLEVLVAGGRLEQVLARSPPFAVRPVYHVQQPVRVVVILVPDTPDVFASPQIIKLNLICSNGVG